MVKSNKLIPLEQETTKMKNAIIHFLRSEEGGRRMLPTSTEYYATTVINSVSPKNWSIVIRFEKALEQQEYVAFCKIGFLMDNAPTQILDGISELVVYEGSKVVGKITF